MTNHDKRCGQSKESRETTELMVLLRTEEKMSMKQIGDIFGVSREAVRLRLGRAVVDEATREKLRSGWRKAPAPPPLTVWRFAAKVREWVRESGSWYCWCGHHVVTEDRKYQMCRECNRLRHEERMDRLYPNRQRRTPEQVARMHRGRWGY